jgi:hypothetical protein
VKGDHLDGVDSDPLGGIPANLFEYCHKLAHLDLSFQSIRKIPDEISKLKNLKILKLKYCIFLEVLSASVGYLPLLNELDTTGCVSLKTPPVEIQRKGFQSIIAYLKRLRTGSTTCKRTKLMFVGLGGAGKSSLMNCLVDQTIHANKSSKVEMTDGICIRDWSIPITNTESLLFSVNFFIIFSKALKKNNQAGDYHF